MTFDPSKPVRTRDGRRARIICTDYNPQNDEPIIALVKEADGKENIWHYGKSGLYHSGRECVLDLLNIPERREFWSVLYVFDGLFFNSNLCRDKESASENILNYDARILGYMHFVFEGDKLVEHNFEEIVE